MHLRGHGRTEEQKTRQTLLTGLGTSKSRRLPRSNRQRRPDSGTVRRPQLLNTAAVVEFPVVTGPPPTLDDATIGLPDSLEGQDESTSSIRFRSSFRCFTPIRK